MIFAVGPEDYVQHFGTPHDGMIPHSGRYEYGSGDNSYQRSLDFKGMVNQMRQSGLYKTDTDIAKDLGMTTSEFRSRISNSNDAIKQHQIAQIIKLREERQMSDSAIAEKLGISGESQVRSLMKQHEKNRENKTDEIVDILKDQVDKKKYLDIGSGTENVLGITDSRLKVAAAKLSEQGYKVVTFKLSQATNPKQKTNYKVLVKDDVDNKELFENRDQIEPITGVYLEDNGKTIRNILPPVSVDPKRVMVRYAEDSDPRGVKGVERDGVIELRRGVEDISLHNANYAQVRIAVDGTHYLKGMAVYGRDDEFPKGVDIIFNTNKHRGMPMIDADKDHSVLKPMKKNPDGSIDLTNPFGATIKNEDELVRAQQHYIGADGKEHRSALNIVNEEGDWQKWKKTIASQMLSKQPVATAKKQLKTSEDLYRLRLKEIMSCTNPVVKKKLLEDFASDADEAAVDLKAARFPRQQSHVIIPINSLKPTEIYAPNYKDGEEVVLVRYPHGGKFEMPKLIVNNRNKEGRETITPNSRDAVGINHKVAEQLSGADFDGDTVLVIPTKGQNIKVEKARKDLIEFEPKESYKSTTSREINLRGFQKQTEMGKVSNLITDMTIKGADMDEIERAVKHSMVVIDAEKHNLDWRQSEKDFGIRELRKKYQDKGNGKYGGASTLISKASGEKRINEVKEITRLSPSVIDPKTGKLIRQETGRAYDSGVTKTVNGKKINASPNLFIRDGKPYTYGGKDTDGETIWNSYTPVGKIVRNLTKTTNMAATDDAMTLVSTSNTLMERVYGNYANAMKGMGNEARKAWLTTVTPPRDPKARVKYSAEVSSLTNKLNLSKMASLNERKAQLIASKNIEMMKKADPDRYDIYSEDGKDNLKKLRNQCIKSARNRTGVSKDKEIYITDKEFEAIQHNAISPTQLKDILDHADMKRVAELAMPKDSKSLTNAKISRIKALANSGYTNAEIAEVIGVSSSTVTKYLNQ